MEECKDPRAVEVLRFWFGDAGEYGTRRKCWFEKSARFDSEIRARFAGLHESAAAGAYAAWMGRAPECLALVIVLDQFPRNMFRGEAHAFASDPLALAAARHALERGFDRSMRAVERLFLYLPFEHSESLGDQLRACELTEPLRAFPETGDAHRYAVRHCDTIRRFGRFPHRNAILGRASRPEEAEFLREPGSGF